MGQGALKPPLAEAKDVKPVGHSDMQMGADAIDASRKENF